MGIKKTDVAKNIGETSHLAGGLVFSAFPTILAVSKSVFEAIGRSFFFLDWGLKLFGNIFNDLSRAWSKNVNFLKVGASAFDWINFGILTVMLFGATALSVLAQLAVMGAMLILTPAFNLAVGIGFFALGAMARTPEEIEAHFSSCFRYLWMAGLSGLAIGSIGALLFVPGLQPIAAGILATLGTISAPYTFKLIGSKIFQFGSWVKKRVEKWFGSEPLIERSDKPKIEMMWIPTNANKDGVSKNQNGQIDKNEIGNGYYAHLRSSKPKSINDITVKVDQMIVSLEAQRAQQGMITWFFEDNKRNQKIHALNVLKQVLGDWDRLYRKESENIEYDLIRLENNMIINNVQNPHTDDNITQNRERIIKRVEQYVLTNYSSAFQSFFREQGAVETMFQQAFGLMRSMKTQKEIAEEKIAINNEINTYTHNHEDHVAGIHLDKETSDSIELLRKLAGGDANITLKQVFDDPGITESRVYNGDRWKIYQRIMALHESQALLKGEEFNKKIIFEPKAR